MTGPLSGWPRSWPRKRRRLPEFLRNSVTWDQGKEMARHAEFTVRTGLPIYFCDRTHRGSAVPMRTPTGYSDSIFRKAPICPCTPRKNLIE